VSRGAQAGAVVEQAGAATTKAAGAPGRGGRGWWLGVALAAAVAWALLTWPLALHLDGIWFVAGDRSTAGQPHFATRPGAFTSGDVLQNVFIDAVVVDNARALREPYLDLREGAAGPRPLRTTSLNLPWTVVVGVLWPLAGLVPAYNATLALSTVATALAAFGLLRRHTRWPLLAAAGALLYAASPNRTFQLSAHFNAVMWWAFPAACWAWEVMLDRFGGTARAAAGPEPPGGAERARRVPAVRGRSWGWPALALAAVVLTVGVSGEYHLTLYLAGLLSFLVAWEVAGALLGRRPPPWPLAAAALAAVAVAAGYVLVVFARVFRGTVGGGNGRWQEVVLYAPRSLVALVHKELGEAGEGMVYVGVALLAAALAGAVVAVARRGPALPYAALLLPLVPLTFGPAVRIGPLDLYRLAFEHLPLLSFQRVPQRLMVVTALVLVVLAVVAADRLAGPALAAAGRGRARRLVAAALALATVAVLADYRVTRNVIEPGYGDNRVVTALRSAGDRAGPVLGLPVLSRTTTWNSATTYLAALARRRTLNAYNQTWAPWLDERLARLDPLNRGVADPAALAILRATGTRQVVVIDEPRAFPPGAWRRTIDALVGSGRFRLAAEDGPVALLEVTG
jgi:hypothetical protein